jgi:NADH dehydrogenase
VGGGFAGVDVARHLRRLLPRDREIILFSRENHFVFTPLLGEVVGASINPMHVVRPIRQMARRVTCRTATITGVDFAKREVQYQTESRPAVQEYEHLVIACGLSVKMDLIPGMAAHGWPVRTLADVLALRNHVIGQLERAEVEPDPERRRRLLSFVIVGGGFSGGEVAGEIRELLLASCRFYTCVKREDLRTTILEGKERVYGLLPESLSDFALRKMKRMGIDVRLNARAVAVTERGVRLDGGEEIESGTVINTIGNTVNPLVAALKLPLERDRIKMQPEMRIEGHGNVWALGDCAAVPNEHTKSISPALAQYAVRQAKQLAFNIARVLRGQPTRPFSFKPLGELASIGHHSAVGTILGVKISGFLAWFIWRGIYLSKMPGLARKVQIAFDWAWNLVFPRDLVQVDLRPTERLGREHFEPGQVVFRKGDFGDKFYIIERGRAGRYLDESSTPIVTLGPGSYFGEIALLESTRRFATVRAEEALDVLTIDKRSFSQLMKYMDVLRSAVELSAQRIKAAQEFVNFAKDHPKTHSARVGEVMSRPVSTLPLDLTFAEAIRRARQDRKGAYPILNEQGALVGILTRTDLYRALITLQPLSRPLSDVMKAPVLTVQEGDLLASALQVFLREPIRHLVVVNGRGAPVGMLTPFDVLSALIGTR